MKVTSDSIRVVVEHLQIEHPGAGENSLVEMLAERMESDRTVLMAAAQFAISAHARKGLDERLQLRSPLHRARDIEAQLAAAAAVAAKVVLLNLQMPNGKAMRCCTGEEMGRFGASYQKIANRVGKANLVGAVLTEPEVRALIARDQSLAKVVGLLPPWPSQPRSPAVEAPARGVRCHL
jgi:hypothetical protein